MIHRILFALVASFALATAQQPITEPVFRGLVMEAWIQKLTSATTDEAARQAGIALHGLVSEDRKQVERLLPLLTHRSTRVRRIATWVLGRTGPAAVPGLKKALGDHDDDVRENAARSLGWAGADAAAATPDLIKILKTSRAFVRDLAADALGAIGLAHPDAIPTLIEHLAPAGKLDRPVMNGLCTAGEAAVSPLMELLKDPTKAEFAAVTLASLSNKIPVDLVRVLDQLGPEPSHGRRDVLDRLVDADATWLGPFLECLAQDKDAMNWRRGPAYYLKDKDVPLILPLLSSKDPKVRLLAAEITQTLKSPTAVLVGPLTKLASDENAETRREAVHALKTHAVAEPETPLARLKELCTDEDEWIHGLATSALANLIPHQPTALETLRRVVATKSKVAPWAALALAEALPTAPEREAWLALCAKAETRFVASRAAELLASSPRAGSETPVTESLREALKKTGSDGEERRLIDGFDALRQLEVNKLEFVSELAMGLSHESQEVQRSALYACRSIGPGAKPLFAKVRSLCSGSNVREEALRVLGEFGTDAHSEIPYLISMLSDRYQSHQRAAAESLGELGPAAWKSLLEVIADEDLGADDLGAAYFAGDALRTQGAKGLPAVEEALASKNPALRGGAIRILADAQGMGDLPSKAVTEAVKDSHWYVRGRAADAWDRVFPDAPMPESLLLDEDGYVRQSARSTLDERRIRKLRE